MLKIFVAGVLASAGAWALALPGIEEDDVWGGRKEHPAVVNPVLGDEAGSVLSLRGEWEFTAQGFNLGRNGIWWPAYREKKWPDTRTIQVPGCWEAQGVGKPGMGDSWDQKGDHNAKPIRHKHMGSGWYRKTVAIPAAWKGKRVWLKVGGVKSVGWFWVNDQQVAFVDNYCGTYKYEVTDLVTPGADAKVVVQVKNDVPSRKGLFSAMHRWGGIYRDVEFEATPQTFIDDAWVRGDFDKREAEVHVAVAFGDGDKCKMENGKCKIVDREIRFSADGKTESFKVDMANAKSASTNSPFSIFNYTFAVPLAELRPWSPEHPNLYTGIVELVENGKVVQTRRERFGVRKFEVRGKDFYLNDKPFFMRGCGFHEIDPIYGRHRPRREDCRARIAKARAAGFNFARLHTRCESPEFFDAADELGLMLQPELPYYGDFSTGMAPFEPLADAKELWENFRSHPSFAVYCGGNEGTFGPVLGKKFYSFIKEMDPDRLVIEQDTMSQPLWKHSPSSAKDAKKWRGAGVTGNKDLANYRVSDTDDFIAFPDRIWPRGKYDPPCPMIAHEFMNLSVKSDTRLENDYTGMWDHPVKRSVRGEWLARFGLDHSMGDRLQDAQHHLQAVWQKLGIESARKDPHCDGYYFWSLTDCTMANEPDWNGVDAKNLSYLAQGLLTPFLTEKIGGQTLADFAAFNSPVGVFIDAKPEYLHLVAGETFSFDVLFANYGEGEVRDAKVKWSIRAAKGGGVLASGLEAVGVLGFGGVRKIAAFEPSAPKVEKAIAAELSVEVTSSAGTAAHGRWACWLFPKRIKRDGRDIAATGACRAAIEAAFDGVLPPERAAEAKVVVADAGSPEVAAALARGQSVIEIGGLKEPANIELGWWFHKNIVGAVFDVKSPLLKYLPESECLSTLHFRIFKKGLAMPVKDFPASSLAVIGEEQATCRANLGERVDANGGRHIFAYGLALDQPLPEAVAILDGLVDRAHAPLTTVPANLRR